MEFINIGASGSHLLSATIFSPFIGVLLLFFVPAAKRGLAQTVAGLSGLVTFGASLCMLRKFEQGVAKFQLTEVRDWIPAVGVKWMVGVDGLSLWLVVLTTFLTLLVIAAAGSIHERVRSYLACLLILEVGMLGAFLALDGITFYVFWELMLIPMYFLIGIWGGKRKIYAAIKFVLFTALGSLLMLVAIVYLGIEAEVQLGQMSFFLGDWMRLNFVPHVEMLLFAAFALAFAIKVPIFPLHTWLPDAHVEAPTGGSVILAGVLLKLGLYGLLRFCLPVFPHATVAAAPLFVLLAVIGIVYGALMAWVQTDIKKLVAYSSVSHLGFCVLGFAAMNFEGVQGAILQMINHGISTGALFFLVGVLYDRKHTRLIADYGGLASKIPLFSFVFLVFTLSSIGLPLTNGFVGEFLVLLGGFAYSPVLGAIAVSGVVLGAMYMLSLYRRVVFGKFDEEKNGDLTDLTFREMAIFTPLLILVFYIGLYPGPLLASIRPATETALRQAHAKPDSPTKDEKDDSTNMRMMNISSEARDGSRMH